MHHHKRLGIPPHSFCKPLVHEFGGGDLFDIIVDVPTVLAVRLREHDLDAAFLTPLDYARESPEYRIVPGVAVSSQNASNVVLLHLKEGIHGVTSLAVNASASSEIVLAKIILAEEFDVAPAIVPMHRPLDDMLVKADASLLVGDDALRLPPLQYRALDLVEAWSELTDLPYVHGLWCGRDDGLTPVEIQAIQHARDRDAEHVDEYTRAFSYDFGEDVAAGLREFLQYSYYHGVLPEVPDLRFYPIDSLNGSPPADLYLN
jgi:chorismate dehydratase